MQTAVLRRTTDDLGIFLVVVAILMLLVYSSSLFVISIISGNTLFTALGYTLYPSFFLFFVFIFLGLACTFIIFKRLDRCADEIDDTIRHLDTTIEKFKKEKQKQEENDNKSDDDEEIPSVPGGVPCGAHSLKKRRD